MGFDDFQDDKKNKRQRALIERAKEVASKGLKERSGREKHRETQAAKVSGKKTKQVKKDRAQATELDLAGLEVTEQEAGSQDLRTGTTPEEANDEIDFGSLEDSSPTIDISELKKDISIGKKKKKEKKAEKTISGVFLKEPTQRQSGSFVYDAKTGQWKFQDGSTVRAKGEQGSQEIKQRVSDTSEGKGDESKFSEIGAISIQKGKTAVKERTVPGGGTAITGIKVEENLEYESFSKLDRKEDVSGPATLRLNKTGAVERENEDETFLETATVEAKLVVKAGKLKRKVFSLNEDTVYIGRSIDADITIPDARASRKHAEIRYSDGEFILEDLNSANGIKVNGVRVSKHLLQSQDKIAIGHTVLEFVIVDPAGYTEPDDSTIELDIDDERPTELATAMTGRGGAGGRNQASIQSAKTEVAEDLGFTLVDPVHGTRGGVTQDDLLPDEAFNQDSLYDSPFGGALKEKKNIIQARSIDRPVETARLLRKFFLSVLFIILVGALGILLMYSGTGSKKEIEKGKPVATIPRSSSSGLSPETEQLAIKHYYRARDLYEAENYPSAIKEAKKALGVYPDFSQAKKIIEYSRDAIKESKARTREETERRTQEERYNFIDNQLNKADKLLMAKRYREAIVPINSVLKIDKTHQGALDLLGEAKSGIVSRTRAIQDRKKLRRTMLARYNHADRLYSSKKYVQALAAYNRVLVMGRIISPGIYDRAKRQYALSQRRIVQRFQPRLDEIKGNMRAENYSDALKELNGILRVFPAHREAAILRREAYEELTLQVKKIYQRALVVESVNDLEEANEMYQEILKLAPKGHPYYSKAVEKLKKYN